MRQPCANVGGGFRSLGIAFGRAAGSPSLDGRLLRRRQLSLVRERPGRRIRVPRRHHAVGDLLADRARPRAHFLIADERHRRDLAGPMAGDAVRVQNRRDVTRERRDAVGGLWRRLDAAAHGDEALRSRRGAGRERTARSWSWLASKVRSDHSVRRNNGVRRMTRRAAEAGAGGPLRRESGRWGLRCRTSRPPPDTTGRRC